MELHHKPCIISVGIGAGYAAGIDRLDQSLRYNGFLGDTMFWKDYPKGCPRHEGEGQYNFKVFAFNAARAKGYKIIMWCDASLYAIADPMPMFDFINDKGLYFFKSGYPLSATATDRLLNGSIKRESLVDVPEFATGCVGINFDNPWGRVFFQGWEALMEQGLFGGNRVYDERDSRHPLFKFSRQDQSVASMVLHKLDITTAGEDKNWISYYPNKTESTIFFVKGA